MLRRQQGGNVYMDVEMALALMVEFYTNAEEWPHAFKDSGVSGCAVCGGSEKMCLQLNDAVALARDMTQSGRADTTKLDTGGRR